MRRLALLISLVLGASMLSAPPAAAAESGGATYNVPPPWGTQAQAYNIITHVEAAIRNVPGDADRGADAPEALITTYLLDRKKSIDELIAACRRGVSVRVIIDKGIETDGSVRLAKALNGDNTTDEDENPKAPETGPCGAPLEPAPEPELSGTDTRQMEQLQDSTEEAGDGTPQLTEDEAKTSIQSSLPAEPSWGSDQSYLTKCQGSCRGGPGSMHTKFYAFSRTGGANNVVMVSSSNLNKGGATKGWNDLFTMKGAPLQYAAYEQVHNEMGRDRNVTPSDRQVREGPFVSRFFPMESGTKANDPTLDDLNQVRCSSDFGRTRISINMFYWQGVRGEYLLDKVLELAKDGCVVNIIIGAPSLNIAKRLRAASRARQIKVWDSRHWTKNRVLKVRTHNKYVAIKGTYRGDRSAHVVMTGSQNWGHGSLDKSDDSTLNIELGSAYTQYLRHWGQVRKHSIRMAPPR